MARIAGLQPVETTGTGGVDRAGQRTQLGPQRAAPDLQPRAALVNTYVKPEAPDQQGPSNAAALAKALAGLNPALASFAETMPDMQKERQEQAALGKIGGMTFEEAQRGVQEGSIKEMDSPFFKAAFMKQLGQRTAMKKAEEMAGTYANGFNKDSGDVEGLIAGTQKPVMETYGDDPHFASGFNAAFTPAAAKLRAEQSDYKTSRVQGEVRQGVYEINMGIVAQGMASKLPTDDIVKNLTSTKEGNKLLLNVPLAEQDAEWFRMAAHLAEGIKTSSDPVKQKELVEKLINADRTAPDGTKLGTIASKREFADKAVKLLEHADKEVREFNQKKSFDSSMNFDDAARNGTLDREKLLEYRTANPGAMPDGTYRSLIHANDSVLETRRNEAAKIEEANRARQLADLAKQNVRTENLQQATTGSLYAAKDQKLINANGTEVTYSAEQQKKDFTQDYLRWSKDAARDRRETPEQTLSREVDMFSRNGLKNPQWESLLATAAISAQQPSAISGKQLPQTVTDGFALYEGLYAKNPRLVKEHMDGESMDFFEAVRMGKQELGLDPKTAFMNAQEINKDPTKYQSPYYKQKFAETAKIVDNAIPGWLFGGSPAVNAGELGPQVAKAAEYFAKAGASPTRAAELAKERVAINYTNVNGFMVHTPDKAIPKNFATLAENYLGDYAVRFGATEGVSKEDLTVMPVGNAAGQFRIVHKKNPALIVDQPEGLFTMGHLNDFEKLRVEKAQAAKTEQLNRELPAKLLAPHLQLDKEERALEASSLGGAYRASKLKDIAARRAKLGERPVVTSTPQAPAPAVTSGTFSFDGATP